MHGDVADEDLLRAGVVTKAALRPKADPRAERRRLENLEHARSVYVRRAAEGVGRVERQVGAIGRERMLAHLEALHGSRERALSAFANFDSVLELARTFIDLEERKARELLALKGTIQALLHTEPNSVRRRQLRIKMATPIWVDFGRIADLVLERDRVTRETGVEHHIDHIVPLAGRNVCGLHVHHNMRVVEARVNLSKGAKFLDGALEENVK